MKPRSVEFSARFITKIALWLQKLLLYSEGIETRLLSPFNGSSAALP